MASSSANLACSRSDSTPIGMIEVLATYTGLFQVNLLGPRSQATSSHSTDLHESDLTRLTLLQLQEYFQERVVNSTCPSTGITAGLFKKERLPRR